MGNSNITGRLIGAARRPQGSGYILVGQVYEDVRGRFYDGEVIRTSRVVSEDGPIVLTANSIYEVESWGD